MYYVIEQVAVNRVVSVSQPTRSYDIALSMFDRAKKTCVKEVRMIRVVNQSRTLLKYVMKGRTK